MKRVIQFAAVALAAALISAAAIAGECCDKAVRNAKAGKVREKCAEKACCKEAVAEAGETKPCKVCADKEKK